MLRFRVFVVAPNNFFSKVSKWTSCAGQSAKQNWAQVGLDAVGLIPVESTIVKSGQLVGAIASGSYAAYKHDGPGAGLSGGGLVLAVMNAEKGTLGKNLAEAVPVLGMGASAVAIGNDIFGSKAFSSCTGAQ